MDWFDELQKKKSKGIRRLSQHLEDNGFSIVEEIKGGKHLKIKVRRLEDKNDVNAESVVTTVSHRIENKGDAQSRLGMVLNEIKNLFKGRKRRGQGEFKLSENYEEKTWTDILKQSTYYEFIQLLVDADLPVQMARKLNNKAKEMYSNQSKQMSDSTVFAFNKKVRRMPVLKRTRIANKIAGVYQITDDNTLKPGDGSDGSVRSQTRPEQFENITDDELELLVKYMLHLIETM